MPPISHRRILVFVALAGCGGAGKGAIHAPDTAQITRDVEQQYQQLAALDADGWATHFAPDAVFLGSGSGEVWVGHDAIVAGAHRDLAPFKRAGSARSKWLQVGVAPDGSGAWIADEVDVAFPTGDGTPITLPLRVTEVLAPIHGTWVVLAGVYSVGLPNDDAFALAAAGKLSPLADVGDGIGAGADELARLSDAGLADPPSIAKVVSERDDVQAFGSAPDEAVVGGAKVRALFGTEDTQAGIEMKRKGGMRAGLAAGGSVGWTLCNVDFTTHQDGKAITQPYRALLVYLKEAGGWRMVQVHFSNGVPDQ